MSITMLDWWVVGGVLALFLAMAYKANLLSTSVSDCLVAGRHGEARPDSHRRHDGREESPQRKHREYNVRVPVNIQANGYMWLVIELPYNQLLQS